MARKSTEKRREQISEAMLETMAEHGYAKASMQRIAQTADITPGLIHYHFEDKQSILLHLLDKLVDRQHEQLEVELAEEEDPVAQLDRAIDVFLAAGDTARPDQVAAWVTISAEAIRQPNVREAFADAIDAFQGLFVDLIERGVDAGEFAPADRSPRACAAALLSTIQGYLVTAAVNRESIPRGSAAPATRAMARGLLGYD